VEKIVRLRIVGIVQGVGYRAFVADAARRRGLAGWVRNRADRSVEAVVGGAGEAVGDMIVACRHGPAGSRVEAVDVEEAGAADLGQTGQAGGFSILRTV
jgi:acylphosphatase